LALIVCLRFDESCYKLVEINSFLSFPLLLVKNHDVMNVLLLAEMHASL